MTTGELLTLDELAAFLKVSRDTVYRMAQQKKIPGVKVGNQWRFLRDDIDSWLRADKQIDEKDEEVNGGD